MQTVRKISKVDMVKIRTLKTGMNSGRFTIDKEQMALLISNISINK